MNYEKLRGMMMSVSITTTVILCIILFRTRKTELVEIKNLNVYTTAISSKIPVSMVKINDYMYDVKCKDTVWTNDLYVDSEYNVWLNPNTHIYFKELPNKPIKVIRLEDSSFIVDLTKCKNDYKWLMYDRADFKLQGFYSVKQVTHSERLKNDTTKN